MLHSEDADINKVIREIIDLDKKAVRIKINVMGRAEKILDQTKKSIVDKEKAELNSVQEIVKNNYKNEMVKANDESLSIINSMKQNIVKIRCRYDEKKIQKATEVLDKLFET